MQQTLGNKYLIIFHFGSEEVFFSKLSYGRLANKESVSEFGPD